ncbi:MAG: hypothetical protein FH748_05500 [Balneolaceae bacterium]|nr:hypothetical protein [Balneolaceae bacterium]
MESRDDAVAAISVSSLSRPEPPARSILSTPGRKSLYARAGYGSFVTPEFEAYGFLTLDEQSLISGNTSLRASDGHLNGQDSGFRDVELNATYIRKMKKDLKLSVDVGGFSTFNHLFKLESPFLQNSIGKTPEKLNLGFGTEVRLEQITNALEGWSASVGGNLFGSDFEAGNSTYSGKQNELTYRTSLSKYWAGKRMYETFNISGSLDGGTYDVSGSSSQQWVDAKASAEYRRLFNFSTHLRAKAGVEYVSDPFSNKVYIVPEIELKHNLKDAIIVSGNVYARPQIQSVQAHNQYNRFLNNQLQLQHSYAIGARAEVGFQPMKGNRIFGGISYEHTRDYAYYQRNKQTVGGTSMNEFYGVNYGDVDIIELFVGITQQLIPEKFWFDARLYGRNPNLNGGGDIPYEERLGLNGSMSYKPVQKLTVNSWTEYTGKREDPASGGDLGAYMLVNGGAEYQITDRFGAYIKVLNILGQKYERWDGYEERPFQVFGGLTVKL